MSIRKLNRRKSASCGHCSFRLISPPMKFPPQAVIGGSSLDPHLRMLLAAADKQVSRSCLRKREHPVWRRMLTGTAAFSRRTGAQSAPGKGTGESLGKASFPPGIIPSLFLCPEASNFSYPRVTGGGCLFSPASNFANYGSRDEPRATACGGCFARGEINRNEQCPHEADLRRLRLRTLRTLAQSGARSPSVSPCWKR